MRSTPQLWILFALCGQSSSFSFLHCTSKKPSSTVILFGKAKRGRLGSLVEDGIAPSQPSAGARKSNQRRTSASNGKKNGNTVVSPDLAKFMESKTEDNDDSTTPATKETNANDDSVAATVSFERFPRNKKKSTSARRVKQSQRVQLEEQQADQVRAIVQDMTDAIDTAGPTMVRDVVACLRALVAYNTRQLTSQGSSSTRNYRLCWAGSDTAVCHVGTGLHKVALARLQEVFLTLQGAHTVTWLEVIRILGPFPNVKNLLQGKGNFVSKTNVWTLTYDSMVDGTGKELLAGPEDSRRVELNLLYADARVVVAAMPSDDDDHKDPLDDTADGVLVFVRDEDMEVKLEALRVA